MSSMKIEYPPDERSDLIRRIVKRLEDTNEVFNDILSGCGQNDLIDDIEAQMNQINWCIEALEELK